MPVPEVAWRLQVPERTLRHWLAGQGGEPPKDRGRPMARLAPDTRRQVIAAIMLGGGEACTLQSLQEAFPAVARRELDDLLRRFRHLWRRNAKRLVYVLCWRRPGAVWATDHTDPPAPIDGRYPHILNVRDLASGCTLLSLPVTGETAAETSRALEALVVEHGAPLVLKSDNHGAFTGDETVAFCRRHGITQLLNPPYTPSYNGACEAGHGAIKTRAHHFAARRGQPGHWSCDDIESARLQANRDSRQPGPYGQDAETRWRCRLHPDERERATFTRLVERYTATTIQEWQCHAQPATGRQTTTPPPSSIRRVAIARALSATGLLTYHRRRISPPGTHRIPANIS